MYSIVVVLVRIMMDVSWLSLMNFFSQRLYNHDWLYMNYQQENEI